MDIHKFGKKLDRYRRKESNETESALVEAWYKSYTADEDKVAPSEMERTKQAAWQKISGATGSMKVYPLRTWYMAAAVAVISCGAILFWKLKPAVSSQTQYYTIRTGINNVKQVALPDGSTVWLNAATTLQVSESLDTGARRLILKGGEAFFDVKHNVHRPFLVQTPALTVQVLGTSFNIQAFKSLNRVKVGVANGKVGLTRNGKLLSMLTPGQSLVFDENNSSFSLRRVSINELNGWKDGSTYLTNAYFTELALAIKNSYNITLKPADGKINGYHFTLILKHGIPLNEALKLISKIHNTNFKKEGNEVLIY